MLFRSTTAEEVVEVKLEETDGTEKVLLLAGKPAERPTKKPGRTSTEA